MNDGGNKGRTKAAGGGVAWLIVEELTLFCSNTTIRMLSFAASQNVKLQPLICSDPWFGKSLLPFLRQSSVSLSQARLPHRCCYHVKSTTSHHCYHGFVDITNKKYSKARKIIKHSIDKLKYSKFIAFATVVVYTKQTLLNQLDNQPNQQMMDEVNEILIYLLEHGIFFFQYL